MRRSTTWVWVLLACLALLAYASGLGFSVLILLALSWLTVTLLRTRVRRTAPDTEADPSPTTLPTSVQPDAITDAAVTYSSTATLCDLWIRSHEAINHAYLPSTIESYANLRAAILAELTRRDPAGVERWLNDQPVERRPHIYLRESN